MGTLRHWCGTIFATFNLRVLHYLVYKITAHDALLEDP